jgi:hypothetical protein
MNLGVDGNNRIAVGKTITNYVVDICKPLKRKSKCSGLPASFKTFPEAQ